MPRDTNRFIELLKPNYNDAVKYCRALCSKRSADDAEDVLQQSLLQALEKFDSLNDTDKFRSWLFTIITRVFYTSIKRYFWRRFIPLDKGERTDIPEIYNRTENFDSKALINKALSKLSNKERSAILLFEIAGFSIEEIKNIQNEKSDSAIKSRLSRTRQKLKQIILEMESNHSGKLNITSKNIIEDIENETIKLSAEYNKGK
ncbi:MAG: RNA polymerase sigma factor [Ignavibacteria bacterium]|jgi:RNA polymerase sigma-70 factor (ECF subfamily)